MKGELVRQEKMQRYQEDFRWTYTEKRTIANYQEQKFVYVTHMQM